jgi:hypothetical protein
MRLPSGFFIKKNSRPTHSKWALLPEFCFRHTPHALLHPSLLRDIYSMADHPENPVPLRMHAIPQDAIPKGRSGKHKQIVTLLLKRLNQLTPGKALKIPLAELPDTKANIRSALHRVTRPQGLMVATSSDEEHLYIWKAAGK